MCGIAGLMRFDGSVVSEEDMRGTARMLSHRGPDGEGVHLDGPVGLAHRRLAILDRSETAGQPMGSPDGRYVIVFNGEIYNFLELRAELADSGYRFRSDSDTEVILAAYTRWGEDCLHRFNGMWAFAIWDTHERRLFLSRDRFGVKPLHVFRDDRRFAFSSELKGFLAFPWFQPEFDAEMLSLAIANPSIVDAMERCVLGGITKLRAGHCMTVRPDGEILIRRWWRTIDHLPVIPEDAREQEAALRELVFDACALRLRSDVPLASALSGGLDSSSVHCALVHAGRRTKGIVRRPEEWLRAYVADFPDTVQSERGYAECVIGHVGSRGIFVTIQPSEIADRIEEIVFSHEAVFDHPVATWRLYQAMAQDGIRVSIDGHGGDELFCGYFNQLHDVQFRTFDPDARRLFRETKEAMVVPQSMTGAPRLLKHLRVWPADVHFPERAGDEADLERFDPLNRRLYMDFHYATLPNILANFDRTSMAHGVEIRAPLLDWRVVTYAFALPWQTKIAGGFTKAILRNAMRDLLPSDVADRRAKLGFVSPLQQWVLGSLREFLLDVLGSREFLESPWWDGGALRAHGEQAIGQGDGWAAAAVWPFVQAHLLKRTFERTAVARGHSPLSAARSVADD